MKRALLFGCLATVACAAHAHESSLAYLVLDVDGPRVAGHWDVAVRDLEDALRIDANGDYRITWGEIEAGRPRVLDYAHERIHLVADGRDCATSFANDSLDRHGSTTFAVVRVEATCDRPISSLEVDYRPLLDVDATHRVLLEVSAADWTTTSVLSSRVPHETFAMRDQSRLQSLRHFIVEGVVHIWHGYDHLAFLGLLLLPAVLRRSSARSPDRPAAVVWRIARIVTAFTVAHSVTLCLSALGFIDLPSAPVEAAIAASIVVAGLLSLLPRAAALGTPLAFGFGLVHGLGFASALGGLGASGRLVSLAGFNIGVELGQLAVVAAALPFLFAVRRIDFVVYRRRRGLPPSTTGGG
jgi:hypothetical protein